MILFLQIGVNNPLYWKNNNEISISICLNMMICDDVPPPIQYCVDAVDEKEIPTQRQSYINKLIDKVMATGVNLQ